MVTTLENNHRKILQLRVIKKRFHSKYKNIGNVVHKSRRVVFSVIWLDN